MTETRPGHARWALEEWTVFSIDHHQDPSLSEHPPPGEGILHSLREPCSHIAIC